MRFVDATPFASSLIEGHRDFGYSLETALADIIDNSISAGAVNVRIIADTISEDPWIALADDGHGMSEAELIEAMRLGSKNPTARRGERDLGRFGLGLKSASFSQCRCLTVITRRDGNTSCARWDLDQIADRNDWALSVIDDLSDLTGSDLLEGSGTVVVWQKLDRLSGGFTTNRSRRAEHMNGELARAERHLRLVFHRFLEGASPRVRLSLNGRPLSPIDPMVSTNQCTQKDPEETLRLADGDVRIRCFTLPHHKRVSREEWEEMGGPDGHLKSQGLYVYREDRLIIAGGWLGLARQTELTKLCRISVDIPNTMDADWKIDVKKASAQLPPVVRERLKNVVERYVGTSKRTYRSRGQKLVDEKRYPVWSRIQKDGLIIFRPNCDHPFFQSYAEELPEELRDGFMQCLRFVGAGLPIETLHADLVGNAEAVVADPAEMHDLRKAVSTMAETLLAHGMDASSIPDVMQAASYFRAQWPAVKDLLHEHLSEKSDDQSI